VNIKMQLSNFSPKADQDVSSGRNISPSLSISKISLHLSPHKYAFSGGGNSLPFSFKNLWSPQCLIIGSCTPSKEASLPPPLVPHPSSPCLGVMIYLAIMTPVSSISFGDVSIKKILSKYSVKEVYILRSRFKARLVGEPSGGLDFDISLGGHLGRKYFISKVKLKDKNEIQDGC
jgi:hypothetical protein